MSSPARKLEEKLISRLERIEKDYEHRVLDAIDCDSRMAWASMLEGVGVAVAVVRDAIEEEDCGE